MLIEDILYVLDDEQLQRVAQLEHVALRYARTRTVETGAAEVAAIAAGDQSALNCAATAVIITNNTHPHSDEPFALAATILFRAGACTTVVSKRLMLYARAHPEALPQAPGADAKGRTQIGIETWLNRGRSRQRPPVTSSTLT